MAHESSRSNENSQILANIKAEIGFVCTCIEICAVLDSRSKIFTDCSTQILIEFPRFIHRPLLH